MKGFFLGAASASWIIWLLIAIFNTHMPTNYIFIVWTIMVTLGAFYFK